MRITHPLEAYHMSKKKVIVNPNTLKDFEAQSEIGAKGGAIPPSGPMKNMDKKMRVQKEVMVTGKEQEEKRKRIMRKGSRI